jgi:histidine triad (HIT) family protein
MTNDCIFCKIITGTLPCAKVYEDDTQLAFLDLYPISRGHTLLIPKKHHRNLFDANELVAAKVYPTVILLARAIKQATGCAGLNIIQNNEAVANQVVFHSHIHLIPRYEDDNIKLAVAGKQQADKDQLVKLAEAIHSTLTRA